METNTKDFWDRPEGKFGKVFLFLVVAAIGYGLFVLMPFILLMLTNTLHAVLLGIALLIIWTVVTDKRMQLNAKALFQMFSRGITGIIIPIDPIGIIKEYLKTLDEALEKMGKQLDLLAGQEQKLNEKITKNLKDIRDYMQKASSYKMTLDKTEPGSTRYLEIQSAASLAAKKAARLESSNAKFMEVLNKISSLRKILEKMNINAKNVYEDMSDEVKVKEEEYKSIKQGYSAFQNAKKVLEGNKDEKIMFDETMEFLATDLGNKVGEIERFMSNSSGMLTAMDLDNEATLNRGLAMITEWEQNQDKLYITSPKEAMNKLSSPSVQTVSTSTTKNKYL